MRAVSDTSPLSSLASLGRLDLLFTHFQEIWIPPAVERELRQHPFPSAAKALDQAIDSGTIRLEAVDNARFLNALMSTLDSGEAQAIALATQKSADFQMRYFKPWPTGGEARGVCRFSSTAFPPNGIINRS